MKDPYSNWLRCFHFQMGDLDLNVISTTLRNLGVWHWTFNQTQLHYIYSWNVFIEDPETSNLDTLIYTGSRLLRENRCKAFDREYLLPRSIGTLFVGPSVCRLCVYVVRYFCWINFWWIINCRKTYVGNWEIGQWKCCVYCELFEFYLTKFYRIYRTYRICLIESTIFSNFHFQNY